MKVIRILLILTAFAGLFSACGSSKAVVDETALTDVELMNYGDEFMETGKYVEALAAYQYLMDKFPISDLHIDVQMRMAKAHLKLDNFEEQMEILLRLLRENIIPDQVPDIYCQLGKYYERAAEFNPGITTTDTSDYKEAINYYNMALDYEDSDNESGKSKALYRRGLVEAKIGEINKAIEDYNSVTTYFPDQPYSLLAQVKIKDPYNVTELAMDDKSIRSYKELLGLIAPGEMEETAEIEEVEEQEIVEEQPQNDIDAIIKQTEEEQEQLLQDEQEQLIEDESSAEQQTPTEETPADDNFLQQENDDDIQPANETEETPVDESPADDSGDSENSTTDDSLVEAPADSTSN